MLLLKLLVLSLAVVLSVCITVPPDYGLAIPLRKVIEDEPSSFQHSHHPSYRVPYYVPTTLEKTVKQTDGNSFRSHPLVLPDYTPIIPEERAKVKYHSKYAVPETFEKKVENTSIKNDHVVAESSEKNIKEIEGKRNDTEVVSDYVPAATEKKVKEFDHEAAASEKKFKEAGGSLHKADHHSLHGIEGHKGYEKKHHHDSHSSGHYGKDKHSNKYSDKGGKKSKHHDEAGNYAKHRESEKGHKSAKFGEKQGHKRGHKTKGYHNKFIRDEFHREHKFYDDFHKSGNHAKEGEYVANHEKKHGDYKKGGSHGTGYHVDHYGKKGQSEKGKYDKAHHGHEASHGHESHHKHASNYGKKGGHSGGKHYGYAVLER